MHIVPKINVDISVVIGSTRLPIRHLLRMGRGAVIAFDTRHDAPVDIYANDELIAHGEVVIDDNRVRIRVTERLKRRQTALRGRVIA